MVTGWLLYDALLYDIRNKRNIRNVRNRGGFRACRSLDKDLRQATAPLPPRRVSQRRLAAEKTGYDAAIGGGFDLAPGVVARSLAPAHIIAVAAPAYLQGRRMPDRPEHLAELDGIVMRSLQSGRTRHWAMRNVRGEEMPAPLRETVVFNDPSAMRQGALLGLGVAMRAVPDVVADLEAGALVRLVPRWYADAGAISIYFASRTLLPAKTRVVVDWVADAFRTARLAERFAGSLG